MSAEDVGLVREALNEAARAVTEPRRFHANEDERQQALGQAVATGRAALGRLETQLARLERLNGELRRIFRQRMREWHEHGDESYGYHEEDVEEFLQDAERAALAATEEGAERR